MEYLKIIALSLAEKQKQQAIINDLERKLKEVSIEKERWHNKFCKTILQFNEYKMSERPQKEASGCEPLRKLSELTDPDMEGSPFSNDVELLTVGGNFVRGYLQLRDFKCKTEFQQPVIVYLTPEDEDWIASQVDEKRFPLNFFQGWRVIN